MRKKKNIIIHFGGGKCGSSTIQKTLTKNPTLGFLPDGARFVSYWLLYGDVARRVSDSNQLPMGWEYLSSTEFKWPKRVDNCIHDLIEPVIKEMPEGVAIISYESFALQLLDKRESIARKCACKFVDEVDVFGIFFTRDLVRLIESSYIQWGIWEGFELEDWIGATKGGGGLEHGRQVKNLADIGLTELHVHHIELTNLLEPFISIIQRLGFERSNSGVFSIARSNDRPSSEVFKFLLRNRELRAPHDPRIEFLLKSILKDTEYPSEPMKGFISGALARKTLEIHRTDRELLAGFLDENARNRLNEELEQKEIVGTKSNSRELFDPTIPPNPLFLEMLTVKLIKRVVELGMHWSMRKFRVDASLIS